METQREQRLKAIIEDVDGLLDSLNRSVAEMSEVLKSEQGKQNGGDNG